ncbi:MAG TPA: PAS domain S-box protein [Candidatus Wallbacteria bacterium]|nr:MAG: Sensor histidine kinase TmoS [bacterium ADurb.Bin243]HOD39888.1 PAS domain S-box protein [Candidatus Wallbacteria bacterium]HPG56838.1 PAS domain S-box protein [Candidatus Wallbacteria bacterium]
MTNQTQKNILLVEDESTTASLETTILESYGFDVICVNTGEAAIEKISSNPQIDMVLMDINLGPGIDGTRAAETILSIRELPLIFLSSHTEREVVEKTEGITSYGYIVKNTGETVLIAGVKMVFRLFEARKKEKENYEMQQMVFNQTFQFMGILDTAGRVVKINQTALNFADITEDKVLGLPFWETKWWNHDPAQIQMVKEAVKKAASGETVRLETTHRDINGQLRNIDFSLKPIKNSAGEVIYLIPEGRDITEQKRTETELFEHKAFRSKMFESFKLPIVLMDSTTFKYLDCNPAAIAAYGYSSAGEVIGKTPLDVSARLQYDGTPSAEKAQHYIQRAMNEGSVTFQWLHRRPDGSQWDAEVHLMYFKVNQTSFLQFILIDITHKNGTGAFNMQKRC